MQTDTGSELESDTSSINDGMTGAFHLGNVPLSREQLEKRVESLIQENRVLKIEIETFKLRVKSMQEENKELRKVSVNIQARAEQEEEYISNKLLKKIQSLKKEKEQLANNYEREEEFLTNDLSRKLNQLRNEKVQLEQTLEQEQEHMVNKLMRKIEKLEAETSAKQSNLEQLRREKIELENTLEQEQESLVNRLWKRMERLEAEKRLLQEKLDQPVSAPLSPRNLQTAQLATSLTNNQTGSQAIAAATLNLVGLPPSNSEQAATLTEHIINLRREVSKLKANLEKAERDHKENMAKLVREEKVIRDENVRLQRRLQMEVDRREALCRHLSESESSLEMDDERHFNESSRVRTISSPVTGYAAAANTSASNANQAVVQTNTNNNLFSQPASSTNNLVTNQQHPPLINQSQSAQSTDRCPACNQIKLNNLNLVSSPPLVIGRQPPVPSQVNPLTASSSLSSSSSSINSSKLQNVVPTTIGQNNPHVQQAHQLSTSSPMELSKK